MNTLSKDYIRNKEWKLYSIWRTQSKRYSLTESIPEHNNKKQEMSNDIYAPLTLTFNLVTPKINTGHLLVMTNLHVKYKHSVTNSI